MLINRMPGRYIYCEILCFYLTGIQTSQDAKFYGISSKLEKPFSNEGKPLVIQFTVKHEQNIDCGGGYIKLYPKDLDQKKLHGDSPYFVMFGKLYNLGLIREKNIKSQRKRSSYTGCRMII